MALRFAIIKQVEMQVGQNLENVVLEWDEQTVTDTLFEKFMMSLPDKKDPIIGECKWTKTEIDHALKEAWEKTVSEFKKATIRIL